MDVFFCGFGFFTPFLSSGMEWASLFFFFFLFFFCFRSLPGVGNGTGAASSAARQLDGRLRETSGRAEHGVRLARARLSVSEQGAVESLPRATEEDGPERFERHALVVAFHDVGRVSEALSRGGDDDFTIRGGDVHGGAGARTDAHRQLDLGTTTTAAASSSRRRHWYNLLEKSARRRNEEAGVLKTDEAANKGCVYTRKHKREREVDYVCRVFQGEGGVLFACGAAARGRARRGASQQDMRIANQQQRMKRKSLWEEHVRNVR